MPNISDGLVRRILADPGDALTRLVFADWLEESGDPDHEAWAVYIRLRARANDDPNAIDRDLGHRAGRGDGPARRGAIDCACSRVRARY